MPILKKIRDFTETLDRADFYDFYGLMTALAGPACGDHILVGGRFINLKKIVRRLRITVMEPRFRVDYASAYSTEEAKDDLETLEASYNDMSLTEKQAVAKIICALRVVVKEKL